MKRFESFRLDTANQCLWQGEARADLTPKAFDVLCYLVEHAGRLVTPDELLEALWPETYINPEGLRKYIQELRKVLGDRPDSPAFIETLPKRGYQFVAPVVEEGTAGPPELPSEPAQKIVGREPALAELERCLAQAQRGRRQIVFVTGEPGIGKTTLVDEFQRWARGNVHSLRIARGQCVEGYGGREPYFPMLEAVGQLCHGSGDSMVETLATQAPTWLVQFPALVKREYREILQREILGATRERMLREINEALETITSEKPLMLVLEDLHWVDSSTVDLISALARRRTPAKLMLISTYRPVDLIVSEHPLKALKQDLQMHQLCREIALEPLGEPEVAAYLAAESIGADVPQGLVELIYQHTEGNPLFMVAALEHMTWRGFISSDNGNWKLNVPLKEIHLEVPESLRQMIEAQIDTLSREEQQVLELASLESVGRSGFKVVARAAAGDLEPQAFEEVCERLARRRCILRSAGSESFPDGTVSACYEFVHTLYREVCYGRIAPGRRAKLHRRIGEWAEAHAELREAAPWIASHFEQAADWPRAVKHLLLAADTAGRRFEPRQAAAILEHALELVEKIPEPERAKSEIEVLQMLSSIYLGLFDPRALEAYEALAARAARHGLADVEVRALLDMVVPLANFASPDGYLQGLERLRLAQSRYGERNASKDTAIRVLYLSRCMGAGRGSVGALEECKRLAEKVREGCDRPLLGEVQFGLAYYLRNFSEYREAHKCADEGFENCLADDDPFVSWAFWLYADLVLSCLVFLGAWGEALRHHQKDVERVEKNGDRLSATAAGVGKLFLYIHAMDFGGAQQIMDSALPFLASAPTLRRYCLIWGGLAEAGLGNHERALEYLLTCRSEMDQHPAITDWYVRMPLQQGLVEAWLCKGDLENARAEAEESLGATLATGERTFRALAFDANARVAMAEQDLDRALECVGKAEQAMEGFEVPLAHWRVHGTAYELHRRLGNRDLEHSHRELSCATIMKLANSLPTDEPLRQTFLSAPQIRKLLDKVPIRAGSRRSRRD